MGRLYPREALQTNLALVGVTPSTNERWPIKLCFNLGKDLDYLRASGSMTDAMNGY